MISVVYNSDCLPSMRRMEDNSFDLAIVDPPYGKAYSSDEVRNMRGRFNRYARRTGGTWASKYGNKINVWDTAPTDEYFRELLRVSRDQVIWGGNYFPLPPTRCFLIWRKLTISENFTMAMAEYAWTSFNSNAKVFDCAPQGKRNDPRIHPTQKPVALYEWILRRFAKPGMRILDTHVGSGSSRIACARLGFDFVGYEIDPVYHSAQERRFNSMFGDSDVGILSLLQGT